MPTTPKNQAELLKALSQRQAISEKELEGLIQRIQDIRQDLESSALKMQNLAIELKTHVRRNPTDASGHYVVFSNAYIRLAGAFAQGLRRTASVDRVLSRAKTVQAETAEYERQDEARKEAAKTKKTVEQITKPSEDAFDEIYGEVMHAD